MDKERVECERKMVGKEYKPTNMFKNLENKKRKYSVESNFLQNLGNLKPNSASLDTFPDVMKVMKHTGLQTRLIHSAYDSQDLPIWLGIRPLIQ